MSDTGTAGGLERGGWLKTKEAARCADVAIPTIQKWITTGQLEVRRQGRCWLVSADSLLEHRKRFEAQAVRDCLTVEEAASQFKVPRSRLISAIQRGELAAERLGEGRYWRRYLKPADVEAWRKTVDREPGTIGRPARRCPPDGPASYTIEEASAVTRRSASRLREAIRDGHLEAEGGGREITLVSRASLDRWLERLFYLGGGTDHPGSISLREASDLSKLSLLSLRRYISIGALKARENPAGLPVLDRKAFQVWLRDRPIQPEKLKGKGRYYSIKEIAELVQVQPTTVQKDVKSGLLPAQRVAGRPARFLVGEKDLVAWLKERNQRYPQAALRGEELTTREVCQRFGCRYAVLKQGLTEGKLNATRRLSRNGVGMVWGSQDVEEYLASRVPQAAWTLARIAEFTGISHESIRRAMHGGQLPFQTEHHPGFGPRRVVDARTLIGWIDLEAPPYRHEVAHLSQFVSSKLAGRLSGLGQTAVVKAIRARELGAIEVVEDTGPRYYVPRLRFDLWLAQRGLQPSWVLEADAPWLQVAEAAALVGVVIATIQKWLTRGWVRGKRRGRRWLVERQSLLQEAQDYRDSVAPRDS